jgi:hypothetical protein
VRVAHPRTAEPGARALSPRTPMGAAQHSSTARQTRRASIHPRRTFARVVTERLARIGASSQQPRGCAVRCRHRRCAREPCGSECASPHVRLSGACLHARVPVSRGAVRVRQCAHRPHTKPVRTHVQRSTCVVRAGSVMTSSDLARCARYTSPHAAATRPALAAEVSTARVHALLTRSRTARLQAPREAPRCQVLRASAGARGARASEMETVERVKQNIEAVVDATRKAGDEKLAATQRVRRAPRNTQVVVQPSDPRRHSTLRGLAPWRGHRLRQRRRRALRLRARAGAGARAQSARGGGSRAGGHDAGAPAARCPRARSRAPHARLGRARRRRRALTRVTGLSAQAYSALREHQALVQSEQGELQATISQMRDEIKAKDAELAKLKPDHRPSFWSEPKQARRACACAASAHARAKRRSSARQLRSRAARGRHLARSGCQLAASAGRWGRALTAVRAACCHRWGTPGA